MSSKWSEVAFWRACERSHTPPFREEHTFDSALEVQWSDEFIRYQKNRIIVGFCRYGFLGTDKLGFIGRLEQKLSLYKQTGNMEYLVDIANYAMLEFISPANSKAYWPESFDDENSKRV